MATTQINAIHVNESLSSVFRDILYHENHWLPQQTFTEKFQNTPGAIGGVLYVNKLEKNAISAELPGGDFTDTDGSTDQVAVHLNNAYLRSEKVRNITMKQLSDDTKLQEATFEKVMLEAQEAWTTGFTAKVVSEGTDIEDYTDIDVDNVKEKFLDMRQSLRDKKIRPTYAIVNTTVYSAMLNFAGKSFIPNNNEETFRTGLVGRFFGLDIYESTALAEDAAKYRDESGTEKTVDLTEVEMIMARPEDIVNVVSLNMARIKESEQFNGSKCQIELVAGFKVLDSDRVAIKYNTDPTV